MHPNTKNIKQHINTQYDDSYDRVRYLKNQYKGETAYILTGGPSFKEYKDIVDEKLKDKLVISLKQSLIYASDFHILNFCNLSKYNYSNKDTIVGWTVWDDQQPHVILENFPCDFILDTFKLNDGTSNIENSVAFNLEQINSLDIDSTLSRPWGPGTMYELAIPLALYLGCNNIITMGWDLFVDCLDSGSEDIKDHTYHYDKSKTIFPNTNTGPNKKEILQVIKSTENLFYWLKDKGVNLSILDPYGNNPAYKNIPRIKEL